MVPKKLVAELKRKDLKVFVVSAHIHLEGDALGAELAVASLLKRMGKTVYCVNDDDVPEEYLFLPGVKTVRRPHALPAYDAAVLVDCSDASRIGKISRFLRRDRPLINIDHHISNARFGTVNWVDSRTSCACEMVYQLFCALGMRLNKAEAVLLYTGILSDTGSFRYASTSAATHQAAAHLLRYGIDVYEIHRRLYENFSYETIRAFGRLASAMQRDKTGKVAWIEVPAALIKSQPVLAEQTDEIIRFARAVKGVEVALLFKEVRRGREVRVNLRSRGRVDVNALAAVFGGGGHKMASGCTLKGARKDVVAKVVAEAVRRCS
ncbi:MAG: bifunctional oligoribonuclease/PAP phosphatase NrnA [Candidatus Omnitrophica bacterium]|nr:bifunctional oligoribonuclease/PAP phosphatase NrnA [Candidatus Omnitrophota bacterium]MDD5574722.1 bifunctional oligoribonuclease/PAP phosphatase NrnA [Candidatus Omnitrophota bacterium]